MGCIMADAAQLLGLKNKIIKLSPDVRSKMTTLLTGASGTGKTYQLRTLLEGGLKMLVLSSEKKLPTLQDLEPDVWPIHSFDFPRTVSEKRAMLAAGASDMMEVLDFLRNDEHEYDVVALDSGMRYLDDMAQYILNSTFSAGGALDKKTGYGVFAEKANEMFKVLVSLADVSNRRPVHVVVTFGVEVGNDWQQRRKITPIMEGQKFGPKLPYLFDNHFYLRKHEQDKKVTYHMCTGGDGEFDAKYSSAVVKLPAVIEDPNLYRVLCKLEGK